MVHADAATPGVSSMNLDCMKSLKSRITAVIVFMVLLGTGW